MQLVHVYYDTVDWRLDWSMDNWTWTWTWTWTWMDGSAVCYIHTTQSQRGQSKVAPIVSLQSNKEIKASGEKGEAGGGRKSKQTNLASRGSCACKQGAKEAQRELESRCREAGRPWTEQEMQNIHARNYQSSNNDKRRTSSNTN